MAKSRDFPRVSTPNELMEAFDARMSGIQLSCFWRQVEGWHTARDHLGRTPFMVNLAATRGRDPELYRLPHVQQDLLATDDTGRNLWPYALKYFAHSIHKDLHWTLVLERVPAQPNTLTGRGLLVDAVLNPHPLRGPPGARVRRSITDALPRVAPRFDGGKTGGQVLMDIAGKGAGKWWACSEEDGRRVLDRFLTTHSWADVLTRHRDWMHLLVNDYLAPGETTQDIPKPIQAMAGFYDLIAGDMDRGLDALERGVLAGVVSRPGRARKNLERLMGRMEYKTRVGLGKRLAPDELWARWWRAELEHALAPSTTDAPARARMRL